MRLTVVGSGDAFGSGGRANTCFWIETMDATVALDFGATSLAALKRLGLDPKRLDGVILSHLHGDHFGGLPFLLLDAHFGGRGEKPLTIIGPVGTGERLQAALEVFFPGASRNKWRFPLEVVDLPCRTPHRYAGLDILTTEVVHPSGAPSTAVRLGEGSTMLAYSGDTSWTDVLIEVARGADLYISECSRFSGAPPAHLDFETIHTHRARLDAKRIMLTHMGPDALDRIAEVEALGYVAAHDGLATEI